MTDIAASVPTETIIVNDAVTSGTALLNAFNFENLIVFMVGEVELSDGALGAR